jgi:(2Fe-2S) ferredoxin
MKSLKELEEIKKRAQEMTNLREGDKGKKVIIGMGTCGIAAGARDVMTAVMDELAKRNISDVAVTQTGCIGICEQEPILTVVRPGENSVTYGLVTPEKAREIVARHLINGNIIGEWVVTTK